ncbi:MAG: sugar-binding transcriptional regulator [Actinobacteria bacterium]|nr:sugar-binding transcriptional regulator [Actinomycetota bacterium]
MSSTRRKVKRQAATSREQLLCDVAGMYYEQELTQEAIASRVGVTRSMISRLLTEARRRGLVEIRIKRPRTRDEPLEVALVERFGLKAVTVVPAGVTNGPERPGAGVGAAGAQTLLDQLRPKSVLGVGWGTSVSGLVQEIRVTRPLSVRVVQLVGALGARSWEYDGQTCVRRVAERLGGEGYYLHAPFLVETRKTAQELLANPSVHETVALFKTCDLALTGVGSTDPRFSSYYHAGYVPIEEMERLRAAGAVGDVCGHHLDVRGKEVAREFDARLVTISRADFLAIPTRIGIAAGPGKGLALLAAVRGEYLNALVTDSATASQVLALEARPM